MSGWAEGPGAFQMQSWSSREDRWTPMEAGAAPKVWRPRPTREAAVHKCLMWTGLACIPAMRVVDLATGTVVWQDRWVDDEIPDVEDALERIVPEWAEVLYGEVRAELRATSEVLERAVDEYVPVRTPAESPALVVDGSLFTMGEFDA